MQVSNLGDKLNFCMSLSNSIINLDSDFKMETKFFILYERIKFDLQAFEKFSHDNKFQFFDLVVSNFEKYKLGQKDTNKLFITKTKTSKYGCFTTEFEYVKNS